MTELQREMELATRAEARNKELMRQKLLQKVRRRAGRASAAAVAAAA